MVTLIVPLVPMVPMLPTSSSDSYKPPIYRSTPVLRVGLRWLSLSVSGLFQGENLSVQQIRCYLPGHHLQYFEEVIVSCDEGSF